MKAGKFWSFALCTAALVSLKAAGCDLCAVYNIMDAQGGGSKGWNLAIAEQFTHFGTLQENGHEVGNDARQRLNSSITQIVLGHNFSERFGVQLNAPFIYREYRRPVDGVGIQEDQTAGFGDISLLGNFVAVRYEADKSTFVWNLSAGLKLPTGSTRHLREETEEGHQHGTAAEPDGHDHAGGDAEGADHHEAGEADHHEHEEEVPASDELPESGIHGHDLTLGSGSWDVIVGTSVFLRHERFFLNAAVQYTIRTKGDYDYRFANDLTWSGGPGVYVALKEKYTAAIQLNCSGEYKPKDKFRGESSEDTGITAVYLGPEVRLTWQDRISANFGADFPVSIDNSALQIVPDYRLRASVTIRF